MGKMIKIDQKSRKYRGQNIKNSKCQKCLKLTEKQGNTGKKLFFPQNVKIPEIRKFTTNWHPCIHIGMYRKLTYGVKSSLWLSGAVGPQAVAGRHSAHGRLPVGCRPRPISKPATSICLAGRGCLTRRQTR